LNHSRKLVARDCCYSNLLLVIVVIQTCCSWLLLFKLVARDCCYSNSDVFDCDNPFFGCVQANMVRRLKADSMSQMFADNCGNFKQVFPPRDKIMLERYIKLLEFACGVYEPEYDEKRKMEIRHFLIQKVDLLFLYLLMQKVRWSISVWLLHARQVWLSWLLEAALWLSAIPACLSRDVKHALVNEAAKVTIKRINSLKLFGVIHEADIVYLYQHQVWHFMKLTKKVFKCFYYFKTDCSKECWESVCLCCIVLGKVDWVILCVIIADKRWYYVREV